MENPGGIISLASPFTVEQTVARLKALLEAKHLQLFAEIDHAANAAAVGLSMRPAHVLIFGNAQAGTPLMVAAPLLALDLPLKALISQDEGGQVWISYNATSYLAARHGLAPGQAKNIAGIEALLQAVVTA